MPDFKFIYNFCVSCIAQDTTIILIAFCIFFIPFYSRQEFTIKVLYNAELLFFFFLIIYSKWFIIWKYYNIYVIHNYLFLKLEISYENYFWRIAFIYYISMQIIMIVLILKNQEMFNEIARICTNFAIFANINEKTKTFLYLKMRKILHVFLFILNICTLWYLGFDLYEFCEFLLKSWIIP